MLYSCKILATNYTQEIDDLVLLMNHHLKEGESQETLFKPIDSWITVNANTKSYIVEELNSIKLSHFHYSAISIIKYGPIIDNIFSLQNLYIN